MPENTTQWRREFREGPVRIVKETKEPIASGTAPTSPTEPGRWVAGCGRSR